ncbi:MAG: hypothetical protein LBR66_02360 [Candidatus Symbiothrix sp.]|jgi:hypothetical protein|nr:hypothetical protein [Candidatus Symbiothrix sp.]
MKRTKLFYIALMALSLYCCEKAIEPDPKLEEVFHLQGTQWKLAGLLNLDDNTLQPIQSEDCERCYALTFLSDTFATRMATANQVQVNLNQTPRGIIYIPTEIYEASEDAQLFHAAVRKVTSCSYDKHQLKFYFEDAGQLKCLLYDSKEQVLMDYLLYYKL